MKGRVRRFIFPFIFALAGLLLNILLIEKVFPQYLIIDFPLIVIAYFSFFENSEWALLPAIFLSAVRDIYLGGNVGSLFFLTLSIYYLGRYFYRRLYVESELFLFISVSIIFLVETVILTILNSAAYSFSPGIYFPLEEIIRIALNSFVSIPIFYSLIRRTGLLVY